MATAVLLAGGFINNNRTVKALSFDCYMDVEASFSNSTTNHPIEDGSEITDHVVNEPVEFNIKAVISNAPVTGFLYPANEILSDTTDRAQQGYNLLKKLWKGRSLFTLVTDYDTFTNCVITGMSIPQKTGININTAIEVDLRVKQLKIVSNEQIVVGINPAALDADTADDSNGTTKGGQGLATQSRLARFLGNTGDEGVGGFADIIAGASLTGGVGINPTLVNALSLESSE